MPRQERKICSNIVTVKEFGLSKPILQMDATCGSLALSALEHLRAMIITWRTASSGRNKNICKRMGQGNGIKINFA
jgi:hypothetical protein